MQDSCEVPLDWHPRKQRCVKTYEYKILNRRMELPDARLYTYFYYYNLDLEQMRRGAAYLWESMILRASAAQGRRSRIRCARFTAGDSRNQEDVVTIRIKGSGFLYNMVRIIAGTLLNVGNGIQSPRDSKDP